MIAGGYFSSVNGGVPAHSIARWDGSTWTTVGAGFGTGQCGDYQYVLALAETGQGLYAAGNFYNSDGVVIGNAAHFSGGIWESLDSGTDGYGVLALLPDGSGLFAGGDFTHAGAEVSWHIARWMESTTGVDPSPTASDIRLSAPNPYFPNMPILYRSAGGVPAEISLYNTAGVRVRTLRAEAGGGSGRRAAWDGRADDGKAAPAGVYYLVVTGEGGPLRQKIVLLR